jgi:transposase-like protein
MENPKTLQDAILFFSDEQRCIDAVAQMRWLAGVVCPHCETVTAKPPMYLRKQKRWKCRECREQFSVKVGTVMEDSPIPLRKWLPALWLLVNCKNGVSSWEIHRALGVTQKTAWFMLHRLRLGVHSPQPKHKMGGPGSEVEVDESFIGGKAKNMHKDRKLRWQQMRSEIPDWKSSTTTASRQYGKTPVMGIFDRDQRKVRARVIPAVKRETLQAEILRQVEIGTTVYTDEAVSYEKALARDYVHETVNHLNKYVDGRIHTNGLENFWSLFKRGLNGTYVAVEPFHLFRYLDELMFRYNNRATKDNPLDDSDCFMLALSQVAGKRLTYAQLTGKVTDDGTTPAIF